MHNPLLDAVLVGAPAHAQVAVVHLRPLRFGHALRHPLRRVRGVLDPVPLREQVLGWFLVAHNRPVVHDLHHHLTFTRVALLTPYLLLVSHFVHLVLLAYIASVAVAVDPRVP